VTEFYYLMELTLVASGLVGYLSSLLLSIISIVVDFLHFFKMKYPNPKEKNIIPRIIAIKINKEWI